MTAYDDIPYVSRPFRQTHPDRLATMGLLLGMQPADPASARVLEVGCGSAGNLIPLAAAAPRASFFGFDLARTAVQEAQTRIMQLGLGNIRVEHLDLLDFPADAGEFDYIIAHGFYSWVPAPVRESLFALLARHASAKAIAFLSFNACPGSTPRRVWRDAAAYHARDIADPVARARESVHMLELMAEACADRRGAWRDIVTEMVGAVHEKGIRWVAHDDFGPVFEAFPFHEVAQSAARHGLQYLSDACYFDMQPHEIGAEARGVLEHLERQDVLLREQYFDFLELRPFRQILLCRADIALRRPITTSALQAMAFSSPAELAASATGGTGEGAHVPVSNPLTGANGAVSPEHLDLLRELRAAWPCSMPFDRISPAAADRAAVAARLERLWASALIEAHAVEQRCGRADGEHPVVWPLARLQAAVGETPTTRIHSQCRLDAVTTRLVGRLDGSRSRAQLRAEFDDLDLRLGRLAHAGLLEP